MPTGSQNNVFYLSLSLFFRKSLFAPSGQLKPHYILNWTNRISAQEKRKSGQIGLFVFSDLQTLIAFHNFECLKSLMNA